MSNIRYYVVGDHEVWLVKAKDSEHGHRASRNQAVALAISAAQKLGMWGECAHVCEVDDDGRFRPKWTYNRVHRLCSSASGHATKQLP